MKTPDIKFKKMGKLFCFFFLSLILSGATLGYSETLDKVMKGKVENLQAEVRGAGGYYGECIQVTLVNNTGTEKIVTVPLGLLLVPKNLSVQTMVCAGGEALDAKQGKSTHKIKAFCGEKRDSAPGTGDVFSPGGIAPKDLLKRIREINSEGRFDSSTQHLVWQITNNLDIAEGAGGGGISSETATAAGTASLILILIWLVLNNILNVPIDPGKMVMTQAGGTPPPETGGSGESESYRDRPAWSEIHRTSYDQKFDDRTGKWVTYDDWKRQKIEDMAEDGYHYDEERDTFYQDGLDYDEHSDAYRKMLDPEEELKIRKEDGDVTQPKLIPRLISYDESMEPLEERERYLDQLRNEAIERVEEIDKQILEAQEQKDKWLEQQLWKKRAQAEQNVTKVEDAQIDLENRLKNKDQKIKNYEKKYRNWSGWDVAEEVVTLPWNIITSIFSKKDQFLEDAMVNAYDAKMKLKEKLEIQDKLFSRFDKEMKKLRDIRDKVREAREAGDTKTEQKLRGEAEPIKEKVRALSKEIGSMDKANRQWQKKTAIANLAAYKKAAEMTLEGQSVRHTSKMVNNVIDQYRRGNLPWQHRSKMTASGADNPMMDTGTRLTRAERELDAEHFRNASRGANKVAEWSRARMQGVPEEELRQRTIDCCEDYQAKLMQKQAPESIRREWAHDVRKYRDQPLMKEMTHRANERNWVVEESSGRTRPVTENDFPTFSSSSEPGMDLDIGHNPNIIDRTTGKKINYTDVQNLIDDSCKTLKFDPKRQEIIATGPSHPESYRVSRDTSPKHLFGERNVRQMDGPDAEQAFRVSEFKRMNATTAHGRANGVTDKCRTAMKDIRRITERQMGTTHQRAKLPKVFSDEAIDTIDRVGSGKLPPGTGNRLFREQTGMSLDEGCHKINSLQESVVKLDRTRSSTSDSYFHDRWTTPSERAKMADDIFRPGDKKIQPSGGQVKTAAAEQKAQTLRQGDTPETFGRRIGPDEESKSAWSKYDDDHGIPKRGPEDEARLQQQKSFDAHPGLEDINAKIEKAWGEARAEKLREITKRTEAEMEWEGYSREDPDFASKVQERVKTHHLREQYDCQDIFEKNMDKMMAEGELGPTDYEKWYHILKKRGQTSIPTGMAKADVAPPTPGSSGGIVPDPLDSFPPPSAAPSGMAAPPSPFERDTAVEISSGQKPMPAPSSRPESAYPSQTPEREIPSPSPSRPEPSATDIRQPYRQTDDVVASSPKESPVWDDSGASRSAESAGIGDKPEVEMKSRELDTGTSTLEGETETKARLFASRDTATEIEKGHTESTTGFEGESGETSQAEHTLRESETAEERIEENEFIEDLRFEEKSFEQDFWQSRFIDREAIETDFFRRYGQSSFFERAADFIKDLEE